MAARNFIFNHSMVTAILTACSLFGYALAKFRIDNVNGIPANNQLPGIIDIIVDLPALFDTQFILPKFENTDEVVVMSMIVI